MDNEINDTDIIWKTYVCNRMYKIIGSLLLTVELWLVLADVGWLYWYLVTYYTYRTTKLLGGYIGFTLSVRLSVVRPSVPRPSHVRPASHVRSVAPTILVESISYLHILSSNFRRFVACQVSCKMSKFEFFNSVRVNAKFTRTALKRRFWDA